MKKLHCSVMIAVLALAAVVPVRAQYDGLQTGSRLRITETFDSGLQFSVTEGYLSAISNGYLILVNDQSIVKRINPDQITMLEQFKGSHRNSLQGFLVGVGAGGLFGLIAGAAIVNSEQDNLVGALFAPMAAASFFVISTTAGGVLGLIIGHNTVTEKWERVTPLYHEAPIAASGYSIATLPRVGIRISF